MIKFTCDRYDIPIYFRYAEIADVKEFETKNRPIGLPSILLDNGKEFTVKDTYSHCLAKIEEERIRIENAEIRALKFEVKYLKEIIEEIRNTKL
jgi:hypothetical protein